MINKKAFKYIWQGDTTYLILYNDMPLTYIDLDNFDIDIDKIKNKKQEEKALNKIIDWIIEDLQNDLYLDVLDNSKEYYELKYK